MIFINLLIKISIIKYLTEICYMFRNMLNVHRKPDFEIDYHKTGSQAVDTEKEINVYEFC